MKRMRGEEWFRYLTRRIFIFVSGIIVFFLTTSLLDVARRTVFIPSWTFLITYATVVNSLFWLLLINNLVWSIGSLLGLRALSRNSSLQRQLQEHFLFQQPLLLQIVVFLEHGVSGTLYIFLTGDVRKGFLLAWMLVVHVALALIFAPKMINLKSSEPS